MKGLRLPLIRRPDPILTRDELRVIRRLLDGHIDWAERAEFDGRVSEAIIRVRMDAESARAKVSIALGEEQKP